jgi:hypothetical protein
LQEHINEYRNIKDKKYKEHKYGYISGFTKMAKLFYTNKLIINDIKKIIKDFDKNRQKKYTKFDIISYNNKFKTFFTEKCNNNIIHVLK